MFKPVSVSLSGPAFSFLLYETSKCNFSQIGFLLGEIVHNETSTITDNDQRQVNISKTIKINSVMPCPENSFFYRGKINEDKIRNFLGDDFSSIVAWYRFQKQSTFKFTLKDKIIHKQLKDLFEVPPDLFTCCSLITDSNDNLATYHYSQTFVRYHNGIFDRLNVHIANLSEPNNTYQNSEPASETFTRILSNLKIDIKHSQGLVTITKIENAVQKHIDTLVDELSEAERTLFELEEEVRLLNLQEGISSDNIELKEVDTISFEEPSVSLESSDSKIIVSVQKGKSSRGRGRPRRTKLSEEAIEVKQSSPRTRRKISD